MTRRSSRDRNLRDGEIAGTPMIAAHRASYAVAFTRGFGKNRLSSLGAPQTPRCPRSFQARTSAAEGGRLRDAFGAARRRPDRCKIQDQELKTEPLPCLINSAGSSTYPTRKSVRTTQATPLLRLLALTNVFSRSVAKCGYNLDISPPDLMTLMNRHIAYSGFNQPVQVIADIVHTYGRSFGG